MEAIKRLVDKDNGENILTSEASLIYGGNLSFPDPGESRPFTAVNFVTTLEGLTSFGLAGHQGGGDISGFNKQDTFIMGLLRALSDAVMVGANTLRTEHEHLWTPDFISPEHSAVFAELRRGLGKKGNPRNMFVTASGKVLGGGAVIPAVFRTNGVMATIVTTEEGKAVAESEFAGLGMRPEILAFGSGGKVDLRAMMEYLRKKMGIKILLIEGGSGFNGSVVDAGLYDELFLTISPQIIGSRKESARPLFVSGFARTPETAIWHELVTSSVWGNYLYNRYRRKS